MVENSLGEGSAARAQLDDLAGPAAVGGYEVAERLDHHPAVRDVLDAVFEEELRVSLGPAFDLVGRFFLHEASIPQG